MRRHTNFFGVSAPECAEDALLSTYWVEAQFCWLGDSEHNTKVCLKVVEVRAHDRRWPGNTHHKDRQGRAAHCDLDPVIVRDGIDCLARSMAPPAGVLSLVQANCKRLAIGGGLQILDQRSPARSQPASAPIELLGSDFYPGNNHLCARDRRSNARYPASQSTLDRNPKPMQVKTFWYLRCPSFCRCSCCCSLLIDHCTSCVQCRWFGRALAHLDLRQGGV